MWLGGGSVVFRLIRSFTAGRALRAKSVNLSWAMVYCLEVNCDWLDRQTDLLDLMLRERIIRKYAVGVLNVFINCLSRQAICIDNAMPFSK